MENKKYKLTNKTYFNHLNKWLYRIESLMNFRDVEKGDLGGWVEWEENLSHNGHCWIYGDAMVHGHAVVEDDAVVFENAVVFGHAKISGDVKIYGHADVHDDAMVFGHASVSGSVVVGEDAMVHGNAIIRNTAWIHGHAEVHGDSVVEDDVVITDHAVVCGDAHLRGCSLIRGYAHITSKKEVLTVYPFSFGEITCTPDKYHKLQISCGYYFIGGIDEFCQEMVNRKEDADDCALLIPILRKKEQEWLPKLPPRVEDEEDED